MVVGWGMVCCYVSYFCVEVALQDLRDLCLINGIYGGCVVGVVDFWYGFLYVCIYIYKIKNNLCMYRYL